MTRLLLALVRAYQRWISPLSAPRCRYYPSCSTYAAQALVAHGALRGTALAAWRLLRCNPFTPGGYDPVPPSRRSAKRSASGDHPSEARSKRTGPGPRPA